MSRQINLLPMLTRGRGAIQRAPLLTCHCHSAATARARGYDGRVSRCLAGVLSVLLSSCTKNSPYTHQSLKLLWWKWATVVHYMAVSLISFSLSALHLTLPWNHDSPASRTHVLSRSLLASGEPYQCGIEARTADHSYSHRDFKSNGKPVQGTAMQCAQSHLLQYNAWWYGNVVYLLALDE